MVKFKPRSSIGSSGLDVEVLQDLVVSRLGGVVNDNEGKYSLRIIRPDEDLVPHVFPTGV
jgi:hypothetical protein